MPASGSRAPFTPTSLARSLLQPLERFLHVQAASGIALLIATALALIWASSPWAGAYAVLWDTPVTLGWGERVSSESLRFWVNDGLMTVFFLVVGLEIRREMHDGALATVRLAALPVAAALGGVIVPALTFLALNADPTLRHAWAVPTATDIAFAVGVLALLGRRVPAQLRVLLLAIAIIDDIVAIAIIALFYSSSLEPLGLVTLAAGVTLVVAMQKLGVGAAFAYVVPGVVVWMGMLHTGVHPALGGVLLGLLTPLAPRAGRANLVADASSALQEFEQRAQLDAGKPQRLVPIARQLHRTQRELLPPLVRVETALHPWVAYAIVPLFALANAGVDLRGIGTTFEAAPTLTLGIVLGLVLGKPAGIAFATWLTLRLGLSALPSGIDARGVVLVGTLAGIGFTMSIFIATLSLADAGLLSAAKLAVLIASFCAAAIGLGAGRFLLRSNA